MYWVCIKEIIFKFPGKPNTNIRKPNDVNLLEVKIEYHTQFMLASIFETQIAISSFNS